MLEILTKVPHVVLCAHLTTNINQCKAMVLCAHLTVDTNLGKATLLQSKQHPL